MPTTHAACGVCEARHNATAWVLTLLRHACWAPTRPEFFPWPTTRELSIGWHPTRAALSSWMVNDFGALRTRVRRGDFTVKVDGDFEAVIDACADRRGGTRISSEIRAAYVELNRLGFAHSVESWCGDELVGGLYGVTLGGAYFGESMFHRATDASKVALVVLVERMRDAATSCWMFSS